MKDIYKLNLERKPIAADPDTRTNLLVIPHIRIGQVYTTRVDPGMGDGGVPSFHRYIVTRLGPDGVSMSSKGLRVEADYDRLMREGLVVGSNIGTEKVVGIKTIIQKGGTNGI